MATQVTLLLDDDVIAELQKAADRIGRSLEEVAEEALKSSLRVSMHPRRVSKSKPAKPFVVRAKALNPYPGINFDNIEELLEQAEGPAHR